MVSQIQDIEEYYHVDDDDDLYAIFYAPDYYTTDEQLVLIAVLMLLEQRFRLMQSMSPSRVLDELEEARDRLCATACIVAELGKASLKRGKYF